MFSHQSQFTLVPYPVTSYMMSDVFASSILFYFPHIWWRWWWWGVISSLRVLFFQDEKMLFNRQIYFIVIISRFPLVSLLSCCSLHLFFISSPSTKNSFRAYFSEWWWGCTKIKEDERRGCTKIFRSLFISLASDGCITGDNYNRGEQKNRKETNSFRCNTSIRRNRKILLLYSSDPFHDEAIRCVLQATWSRSSMIWLCRVWSTESSHSVHLISTSSSSPSTLSSSCATKNWTTQNSNFRFCDPLLSYRVSSSNFLSPLLT